MGKRHRHFGQEDIPMANNVHEKIFNIIND